jgi:hypothetical protein
MERTATWHIEIFLSPRTAIEPVRRRFSAPPRGPSLATRASLGAIQRTQQFLKLARNWPPHRALSGLAHDLFEATVSDIEQNVHQRVQQMQLDT